MNKKECIKKLDEWGIEHDDVWKNIQKLYFANRVKFDEPIEKVDEPIEKVDEPIEKVDEPIEKVDEPIKNDDVINILDDKIRDILLKDIILLFRDIVGIRKGSQKQIETMFRLYNKYYKRSESPNCSMCVNSVYQKLLVLYKKYKSYYD